MKAVICDRCGKICRKQDNSSNMKELLGTYNGMKIIGNNFDFCDDCKKDFNEIFLNKKNIDQFKAMRKIKK